MVLIIKKNQNSFNAFTDQDLIRYYRETLDTEPIGILFNRYAHLVYGIAIKYFEYEEDRKEAVMQVFNKLYNALLQFEITNFKSWLYSVAKNQCLIIISKNNTVSFNEQIHHTKFQHEFMEFEDTFYLNHTTEKKREEKLHELVMELCNEQRICVELFYLQKKSYKEIANFTKYSLNQVKSFIQNGKRNLKIMLEQVK